VANVILAAVWQAVNPCRSCVSDFAVALSPQPPENQVLAQQSGGVLPWQSRTFNLIRRKLSGLDAFATQAVHQGDQLVGWNLELCESTVQAN